MISLAGLCQSTRSTCNLSGVSTAMFQFLFSSGVGLTPKMRAHFIALEGFPVSSSRLGASHGIVRASVLLPPTPKSDANSVFATHSEKCAPKSNHCHTYKFIGFKVL